MKKTVNISDLYKIFFSNKLVALSELVVIDRSPKKKKVEEQPLMSPFAKSIYDTLTPISKQKFVKEIEKDDLYIDKNSESDPDFQEKMENNGLGFFMEDFVCMHFNCPLCGSKTLCKYVSSNVPVVDVVCTNKDYHINNKKCFLFQIKISVTNNYFDLGEQMITIGSKIYGEAAHTVKGSEPDRNKLIIPGYICIKLYPNGPSNQKYSIDYNRSFIVYPDYNSKSNNSYYTYSENKSIYGKNIISWNDQMCTVKKLDKINIPIEFDVYNNKIIDNPYKSLIY